MCLWRGRLIEHDNSVTVTSRQFRQMLHGRITRIKGHWVERKNVQHHVRVPLSSKRVKQQQRQLEEQKRLEEEHRKAQEALELEQQRAREEALATMTEAHFRGVLGWWRLRRLRAAHRTNACG